MGKVIDGLLIFFGVGLLFLGFIFIIAGGIENILIGVVMIIISFVLFGLFYAINRLKASEPKLISQTFNVKVEGSGKFDKKRAELQVLWCTCF